MLTILNPYIYKLHSQRQISRIQINIQASQRNRTFSNIQERDNSKLQPNKCTQNLRSGAKYRSYGRVCWNGTSTRGRNSVNIANEEIASKHSCQTRFRDRVRLLKPYSLKYQKKIKNVAVIKGLKDHENFKFRRVTLQKLILQV